MTRHSDPMFGGVEVHTLRDGGVLRCGDGPQLSLIIERRVHGADVRYEVARPAPMQGLGGRELVVSPDEQYAALFVYSGQSEQGWVLFAVSPDDELHPIRYMSSLPYVHGQGMAPAFSPDSRWLVMAVTGGWVTSDGVDAEDALDGGEGRVLLEWARIYAQQLPGGPVGTTAICTWIDRRSDPDDVFDWHFAAPPRFEGDRAMLELPWAQCLDVTLPLEGPRITNPDA